MTAHKSDTDDQILSLVNAKSVEWERLLANKDTELIDCHKQIQQLQQQLTAASMDTDKASVIKVSHVSVCLCVCVCVCVCACIFVCRHTCEHVLCMYVCTLFTRIKAGLI